MKKCAFTGQKLTNFPHFQISKIKQALTGQMASLIEAGVTDFIFGMSKGADLWAAEAALDLKAQYPSIRVECVIPCETQAANWPEKIREQYFTILSKCDKETMLQRHYTPDCMQKRNRYLAEHSDVVLAVWDGTPGQAGGLLQYALRRGIPVCKIDPAFR